MANLIKIGHLFLNLDRVQYIEDRFTTTRTDQVVVRFGPTETEILTFSGREADDLRTWLNSAATNLHDANDVETAS